MPSGIRRALVIALAGTAAACSGSEEREPPADTTGPAGSFPLQFDSEVVRLFIEGDTLRVEGYYEFLCRESASSAAALLYPYPADSLLGPAHTLSLEGRAPGLPWRPLEFAELPGSAGARWRVPLDLGDTVEVRTTYRQEMRAHTARYIVTTTSAWKQPLREARFEIHLPKGAKPKSFSYPFARRESSTGIFYEYEARDFAPVADIVVEYEP